MDNSRSMESDLSMNRGTLERQISVNSRSINGDLSMNRDTPVSTRHRKSLDGQLGTPRKTNDNDSSTISRRMMEAKSMYNEKLTNRRSLDGEGTINRRTKFNSFVFFGEKHSATLTNFFSNFKSHSRNN